VTSSAAELNIMDGGSTPTTPAVAGIDAFVMNDGGTMAQIDIDNVATYLNAATTTLSNKILTLPQINDASSDHQYVFAVNELAADRTVTLPLLTGTDEFAFKDHTQTLTNKTLTSPDINAPDIDGGTVDAITSLTVANSVDIGNYTLTANGLTIDGTFTDGSLSIASGSITSATNGTFAILNEPSVNVPSIVKPLAVNV
jgi:hypothetical protein